MSASALVIDEHALPIIDSALVEQAWFDRFEIPPNTAGLRRRVAGNTIYLLSDKADVSAGLLVIRLGADGVFAKSAQPRSTLERAVRIALRYFDRGITMPVAWQAYHDGSRISVYAEPFSRQSQRRLCVEQSPNGSRNIYAFALTDAPEVLSQLAVDLTTYEMAVSNLETALTSAAQSAPEVGNFGFLLSAPIASQFSANGTLEEWCERILSDEQLKFVNQSCDRPIRLRGFAGTGKTQAMAIKCLRELYEDADRGGDKTFAFLTHSSALAHEIVRGMLFALDPSARWEKLRTASGRQRLWIGTLYELAQYQLNYERKGLTPLSLDGRDGRELQRLLIQDAIELIRREPRAAFGPLANCSELAARIADPRAREALVEELMNEFACILDAENIRKGTGEADRYIRGQREPWQMVLPTEGHRTLVLEIHDAYRAALKRERLLSMDQMIADYGRYLSTHEWSHLRDRDGFDVIFVDEYHYFTRVEAMLLHNLFAPRAETNARWPLIMSYDLKQSTTDASLGGGLARFRNPGVGESVKVDLKKVYRYTPQIVSFLTDLDAAFPALDLEGEFSAYSAEAKKSDGSVPLCLEYKTDVDLIDSVLVHAHRRAREVEGGGSQVAVLCMNADLFDVYRRAGRVQGKIVSVTSREDMRELRYARSKCVFSMPEYVAGLQFNTVFLIHVDATDTPLDEMSPGALRRYVSRAYLGASRAVEVLNLACSQQRGGRGTILDGPTANGSLVLQEGG